AGPVPDPARHRDGDPRGRDTRLSRRPPGRLRRRGGERPYRSRTVHGAADAPHAGRDRQPACGRGRASDRTDREPPRPDRPRLAPGRGGSRSESTRLNSSHVSISYAVFCLKKKKEYTLTSLFTI